jgi:hypothetical protein
VPWHNVKKIELAGDFQARECECAEHEPNRQRQQFIERKQGTADGKAQSSKGEYEPPADQSDKVRDAETPNHGNDPCGDVEHRHRPCIAEYAQGLQRDDGEQQRLRYACEKEQTERRQRQMSRQGRNRGRNGRADGPHGASFCQQANSANGIRNCL